MSEILLSILLGFLIGLVIPFIISLLNDMGGLSAILRRGKKKETKVVNGVNLNDISLDCVVNIDAVEKHIDSTLSRIKHELSAYEKDRRDEFSRLPTNMYSYEVDAECLHANVDELIKYAKLFDRLKRKV